MDALIVEYWNVRIKCIVFHYFNKNNIVTHFFLIYFFVRCVHFDVVCVMTVVIIFLQILDFVQQSEFELFIWTAWEWCVRNQYDSNSTYIMVRSQHFARRTCALTVQIGNDVLRMPMRKQFDKKQTLHCPRICRVCSMV